MNQDGKCAIALCHCEVGRLFELRDYLFEQVQYLI